MDKKSHYLITQTIILTSVVCIFNTHTHFTKNNYNKNYVRYSLLKWASAEQTTIACSTNFHTF